MKAYLLKKNGNEKLYYTFIQQIGVTNQFFKGSLRQYKLVSPFIKRIFPFSCLRTGQVAIQAGFQVSRIHRGISHPVIMSVIVGQRGKVIAVDPVKEEVVKRAFDEFFGPERNKCNIIFVRRAVWKEKDKLKLIDRRLGPVYCERYKDPAEEAVEVTADSLKNIMDKYAPNTNYINLTVNGSEGAAIEGMNEYITKNISIAFVLGTRWLGRDGLKGIDEVAKEYKKYKRTAIEMLDRHGYTMLIGDVRPRRNFGFSRDGTRWPFWHALAVKDKRMIKRMLKSHSYMEVELNDEWPQKSAHVLNSPCNP